MQIDAETLTNRQYFGLACVVDGHVFVEDDHPVQVGYVGDDLHSVFACAGTCVRSLAAPIEERV